MSILLVGLNHHTAPVDLRERLALSGCGLLMGILRINRASGMVGSSVISRSDSIAFSRLVRARISSARDWS